MHVREPRIRPDGLQISDDPDYQRIFWRVERWAWVVFLVIIALAIAGLTGAGGPLSERTVQVAGAEVTYTTITRWQTGAHLAVKLPPASRSSVALELTAPYASRFSLDSVAPQPEAVQLRTGSHLYSFKSEGEGGEIVFNLTAKHPGLARYDIVIDGQRHSLSTWIWP